MPAVLVQGQCNAELATMQLQRNTTATTAENTFNDKSPYKITYQIPLQNKILILFATESVVQFIAVFCINNKAYYLQLCCISAICLSVVVLFESVLLLLILASYKLKQPTTKLIYRDVNETLKLETKTSRFLSKTFQKYATSQDPDFKTKTASC